MRRERPLCQLKRRFLATTGSAHGHRTSPDLMAGLELTAVDQARVADLTSIRLPTAFISLACIPDASSRRCVGWALSRRIDTTPTVAAPERAVAARRLRPGLIHHSDRGVQYASRGDVERLEAAGARPSMSAVGDPYDSAKAEASFTTLKREEVHLTEHRDVAEAEAGIGRFIEEVYHRKRLHSALGHRPPAEFEAVHFGGELNRTPAPVR